MDETVAALHAVPTVNLGVNLHSYIPSGPVTVDTITDAVHAALTDFVAANTIYAELVIFPEWLPNLEDRFAVKAVVTAVDAEEERIHAIGHILSVRVLVGMESRDVSGLVDGDRVTGVVLSQVGDGKVVRHLAEQLIPVAVVAQDEHDISVAVRHGAVRIYGGVGIANEFTVESTGRVVVGPVGTWLIQQRIPIIMSPDQDAADSVVEDYADHPIVLYRDMGFLAIPATGLQAAPVVGMQEVLSNLAEVFTYSLEELFEFQAEALGSAFLTERLRRMLTDRVLVPAWDQALGLSRRGQENEEEQATTKQYWASEKDIADEKPGGGCCGGGSCGCGTRDKTGLTLGDKDDNIMDDDRLEQLSALLHEWGLAEDGSSQDDEE